MEFLCKPWPCHSDGSSYGVDVWHYDAETAEWTVYLTLEFNQNNEKGEFGHAFVGTKLYCIGGELCFSFRDRLRIVYLDIVECYDMVTGDLVEMCRMPGGGRSSFWCVAVEHNIYVFGGCDEYRNKTDECLRYDTVGNTWHEIKSMPEARYKCNGIEAIVNNGIIYIGDMKYDVENDNWIQ